MPNTLEWATETYWFAVDCEDHVACFDTGYGPVPQQFAWKENHFVTIDSTLRCLPPNSPIQSEFIGTVSPEMADLAVRGFFTFIWDGYDGPFRSVVRPLRPTTLMEIPAETTELLQLLRFQTVRFREIAQITESQIANDLLVL